MFVNIEAFLFNTLVDAQAMQFLDAEEQYKTTDGSPEVDNQNAKALSSEETPSVTIESTAFRSQQSGHQCP